MPTTDYSQFQFSGNNVFIPGSYFQANPNISSRYGGTDTAGWQNILQNGTNMPLGMAQQFGILPQGSTPNMNNMGNVNDPTGIVSSMVLPQYFNFMQSYSGAQNMMNPNNPQGLFQTGNNAINATRDASVSSIQSQVAQGLGQLNDTEVQINRSQDNTISALSAEQAAISPNTTANTAFYQQQAAIKNQFNGALAQVQQAKTLLQMQGTAAEQQANQQAAANLIANAQNQVQNSMQLAFSGLQAATQVANIQYQAAQFGLQKDQYDFGVKQYEQQMSQYNKQFAIDNGITQPAYSIGGQTYNTSTGEAVDQKTAQQMQSQGLVQQVDSNYQANKSYVTNLATAYPDAHISLSDSVATAQNKIKSSAIYNMALSNGVSGAAKPTGALAEVQKATTMNNLQFNTANNIIQGYLSQHPTLWNMATASDADKQQAKQDMINAFMQYSSTPGNSLTGVPYSGMQALVDFYFADDAYKGLQNLKVQTSKPSNSSIFQSILSGDNLQGNSGSNSTNNINQLVQDAVK